MRSGRRRSAWPVRSGAPMRIPRLERSEAAGKALWFQFDRQVFSIQMKWMSQEPANNTSRKDGWFERARPSLRNEDCDPGAAGGGGGAFVSIFTGQKRVR